MPGVPDAFVDETLLGHGGGAIDVAQVDQDRAAIERFSRSRSSARNCSHSVTITSASAPSAQA